MTRPAICIAFQLLFGLVSSQQSLSLLRTSNTRDLVITAFRRPAFLHECCSGGGTQCPEATPLPEITTFTVQPSYSFNPIPAGAVTTTAAVSLASSVSDIFTDSSISNIAIATNSQIKSSTIFGTLPTNTTSSIPSRQDTSPVDPTSVSSCTDSTSFNITTSPTETEIPSTGNSQCEVCVIPVNTTVPIPTDTYSFSLTFSATNNPPLSNTITTQSASSTTPTATVQPLTSPEHTPLSPLIAITRTYTIPSTTTVLTLIATLKDSTCSAKSSLQNSSLQSYSVDAQCSTSTGTLPAPAPAPVTVNVCIITACVTWDCCEDCYVERRTVATSEGLGLFGAPTGSVSIGTTSFASGFDYASGTSSASSMALKRVDAITGSPTTLKTLRVRETWSWTRD